MIKACSPIGVLFQFTLTILVVGLSTATVVPAAEPEFIPDTPTTHIRSLLKEGTHPKLRWGKFSDYQVQLEQLYGQNGLLPLWFNEGRPTPQAKELVQNLAGADSKGLNAEDYDAELLGQWLSEFGERGANPREIASADVALSLAAMRYVSNLYIGRINPNNINYGLNIEPKRVDLPNLIQKIAQSPQPTAIIETLEPTFPIYERLKEALSRYQRLVKETPKSSSPFRQSLSRVIDTRMYRHSGSCCTFSETWKRSNLLPRTPRCTAANWCKRSSGSSNATG